MRWNFCDVNPDNPRQKNFYLMKWSLVKIWMVFYEILTKVFPSNMSRIDFVTDG